jgi:2-aminoadipate transaminase
MTTTLTSPTLEIPLARWLEGQSRSVLREMVSVVSRPGILSLAGGLPAAELFPVAGLAAAVQSVLARDPRALQYGSPYGPLEEQIVDLMRRRGVRCRPDQVLVTSGAQQGLDIAARMLLDSGRQVAMEELTYTGIHQVVAPREATVLTVPSDLDTGLDVDALETLLADGARPAFLYVMSDAHNPLGVSLPVEKRERLVELAHRYDMLLVEDDPYGLLGYDGELAPPLRALDAERVIYVGSFSKILAPGLRLGWMVAPPAILERAALVKESGDLETSSLIQRTVATYFEDQDFDRHLAGLRDAYRERRDAMLAALEKHGPERGRFSRPSGGMFVFLELPEGVDCVRLLERAVEEEQLAFIPGHAFAPAAARRARPGLGRNCMRLSFSSCSPSRIDDAIRRLAALVQVHG